MLPWRSDRVMLFWALDGADGVGKPYERELRSFRHTYRWATAARIDALSSFVASSCGRPLVVVGSGGSLTAAQLAVLLHQGTGGIAKAVTPLDLVCEAGVTKQSNVLILTAGGRNTDILSALRFAAPCEPRALMAMCMRTRSPLAQLAAKYRRVGLLELDLPSGKDGFLATNSLLAFATVLLRAYAGSSPDAAALPEDLPQSHQVIEELEAPVRPLLRRDTWVVLYGKWGFPAAMDAESKFTEAALGHVQIADFRNFAHGRHHWLAKRGDETAVVALITPEEGKIAEATLDLLPRDIPQLRLETGEPGAAGGLELLFKMLHLVHMVGLSRGIDPGRPGVPSFGRRIYHLRPPSTDPYASRPQRTSRRQAAAILRKSGYPSLDQMSPDEVTFWLGAHHDYARKLESAVFGAVVFDYDGTLCGSEERYDGPSPEVIRELVRLLESGAILGVATGRGKSVRDDLQGTIPAAHRDQVILGYYNGSDLGRLSDDTRPDKSRPTHGALRLILELLQSDERWRWLGHWECRPSQISIEVERPAMKTRIKAILLDAMAKLNEGGVRLVESDHSLDVLAPGASKLTVVKACQEAASEASGSSRILCIGDKGKWPGNDYELLSAPYSLSVDTVSPDPGSCWNLAPPGYRGTQATLYYTASLAAASDGETPGLRLSRFGGVR